MSNLRVGVLGGSCRSQQVIKSGFRREKERKKDHQLAIDGESNGNASTRRDRLMRDIKAEGFSIRARIIVAAEKRWFVESKSIGKRFYHFPLFLSSRSREKNPSDPPDKLSYLYPVKRGR